MNRSRTHLLKYALASRMQRFCGGAVLTVKIAILCAAISLYQSVFSIAYGVAAADEPQVPTDQPPTVQQLVAHAVTSHPSILAKQTEYIAAGYRIDEANWAYWPTPSVSYNRADIALSDGSDRETMQFNLRQPLWTGGKLEAGVRIAEYQHLGVQAQMLEARRSIAFEVIQAYGDAYSMQEKVRAQKKSLEIHGDLLALIKRRAASGLSAQSDIQLAETRRISVIADLTHARAELEIAIEKLNSLVGYEVGGRLEPMEAVVSYDQIGRVSVGEAELELALLIDPQLARLRAESGELEAKSDQQIAAAWPTVSANYVLRDGDVSGTHSQINISVQSEWGAGLAILSAVESHSQSEEAKKRLIEHRKREVKEQIRSSERLVSAARARIGSYETALDAAKNVAESWDRQFLSGKKSWQEVLNATREAVQTEAQLADALGAAGVSEWRLAVMTRGLDWVLSPEEIK